MSKYIAQRSVKEIKNPSHLKWSSKHEWNTLKLTRKFWRVTKKQTAAKKGIVLIPNFNIQKKYFNKCEIIK